MYEIYLLISIVEIVCGTLGASYVIYRMIKVKSKCYVQLSSASSTLTIGLFYLAGYVLLNAHRSPGVFDTTVASNNSAAENLLYVRQTMDLPKINDDDCWSKEIVEYALLVYAFAHAMMALISGTYDCMVKGTVDRDETVRIDVKPHPIDETGNGDRAAVTRKRFKRYPVVVLVTLSWCLPVLCTASICLFADCSLPKAHVDNRHGFDAVLRPLNVSIASNTTTTPYVDGILDKIYGIVHGASQPHVGPIAPIVKGIVVGNSSAINRRDGKSLSDGAAYDERGYKGHAFVVFVLANFLTISYANVACAKMPRCVQSKRLRTFICAFLINWSPSVIDTFTRIYIFDMKPQLLSNILLAVGNTYKLFLNVIEWNDINKINNV